MKYGLYMIAELTLVRKERDRIVAETGREISMNEAMMSWVKDGKAAAFRVAFEEKNEAVRVQVAKDLGLKDECFSCLEKIVERYIELYSDLILPKGSIRSIFPKETS